MIGLLILDALDHFSLEWTPADRKMENQQPVTECSTPATLTLEGSLLVVKSKNQMKREVKWQRKLDARLKYKAENPKKKKRSNRAAIKRDVDFTGSVLIDISYYNMMTKSECDSLAAQVARLYASNRRSENGFNLSILDPNQFFRQNILNRKYPDHSRWAVSWKDECAFDPSSYVYLSADSEVILESIDPSLTYIIGGLVDRNRHKRSSFERAQALGIPTARLPIKENCDLKASHILTVLHVFEIMLKFRHTGDWATAITECLPQRKLK